ncbi:ABC transporter substrate-binding protein [Lapidilactobacillus gannanensis]|uniref:ABC transporter substrate-binding protein n=1 Tax=Lapidilactobacillus gannanensis TaxID=2486002 RepID=A0ABW4BKS7_9LACO|nr:ABC transporter substrate-binding protein [Lapidilactobacillus gannanensis]
MRKILLPLLLTIFLLAGCSKVPDTEVAHNPVIGFSQSGTESSWRKAHTKSIKSELKKGDYEVLYRNAFMNQEQQLQDVRTFISYKVDLIIIAPLQESGWDSVLRAAKRAHIPVIIVDRHIDTADQTLFLTHIGPSFKAEGNRAGLYATNYFADKRIDSINILELVGLSGTSPSKLRHDGFLETISCDHRMKISSTLVGNYTRNKAYDVVNDYLHSPKSKPFNLLYSHSDEMTLGALTALKENHIKPGHDVVIITIDGQENIIKKLSQGEVNCVVECNPDVGWYVVNAINRHFSGHQLAHEIYISETTFSESNINKIPTRNY